MLERTDDTAIKEVLEELINDKSALRNMQRVAISNGIDSFSYEKLSKRVLDSRLIL